MCSRRSDASWFLPVSTSVDRPPVQLTIQISCLVAVLAVTSLWHWQVCRCCSLWVLCSWCLKNDCQPPQIHSHSSVSRRHRVVSICSQLNQMNEWTWIYTACSHKQISHALNTMVRRCCANRTVFKCRRKQASLIVGSLNATGRLFHAVGPATENARIGQSVTWDHKCVLLSRPEALPWHDSADWDDMVQQIVRCTAVQTPMNSDYQLERNSVRNVQPV